MYQWGGENQASVFVTDGRDGKQTCVQFQARDSFCLLNFNWNICSAMDSVGFRVGKDADCIMARHNRYKRDSKIIFNWLLRFLFPLHCGTKKQYNWFFPWSSRRKELVGKYTIYSRFYWKKWKHQKEFKRIFSRQKVIQISAGKKLFFLFEQHAVREYLFFFSLSPNLSRVIISSYPSCCPSSQIPFDYQLQHWLPSRQYSQPVFFLKENGQVREEEGGKKERKKKK